MKKLIVWIVITSCALVVWLVKIILCIGIVIWVSQYMHPEWNGCYPLGKSLYRINWDGGDMIFFTDKRELCGNTSYGGTRIIPFSDIEYNDSTGYDYIIKASYNKNWIIVQTQFYRTKNYRYYIISKDFDPEKMFEKYKMTKEDSIAGKSYKTNYDVFIDRNIRVYSDSTEFAAACKKDNIELHFE